jgi:hypothetical protein
LFAGGALLFRIVKENFNGLHLLLLPTLSRNSFGPARRWALPELPGPAYAAPALEHADCHAEELEQRQPGETRQEDPLLGLEVLLQVNRTGALKPDEHQDRQERATKKETGTQDFLAPCFQEPVRLAWDVSHGNRPSITLSSLAERSAALAATPRLPCSCGWP